MHLRERSKKSLNNFKHKIRHLIKLDVSIKWAVTLGISSKGYYRLAKTTAVQLGLNNQYLKVQSLVIASRYSNG